LKTPKTEIEIPQQLNRVGGPEIEPAMADYDEFAVYIERVKFDDKFEPKPFETNVFLETFEKEFEDKFVNVKFLDNDDYDVPLITISHQDLHEAIDEESLLLNLPKCSIVNTEVIEDDNKKGII
jgi:hypothetical protein